MPGFLRGLVPSLMKTTLNSGTYFGLLFYGEETLRLTGYFSDAQAQAMASGIARTV